MTTDNSRQQSPTPASAAQGGHGSVTRGSPASERVTPASPKCSSDTSKWQDQLGVPSKDSDFTSRNGSRGAIGHNNDVHGKGRQLALGGDGGGSTKRGFGLGALTAVRRRGLWASGKEGDGDGEGKGRGRGDGDRGSGDSEGTDDVGDISAGEKSSEGDDLCWWDTEEEEEEDEEEEEQGGEIDDSSSSESRGDSRGSRVSSAAR